VEGVIRRNPLVSLGLGVAEGVMDVKAEWHKPESSEVSATARVSIIAVEDVRAAQHGSGAETNQWEAIADALRYLSHQAGLLEPVAEHERVAARNVKKTDVVDHPQDRFAIHGHRIKKLDCRHL
jgi:hypothetical protein